MLSSICKLSAIVQSASVQPRPPVPKAAPKAVAKPAPSPEPGGWDALVEQVSLYTAI